MNERKPKATAVLLACALLWAAPAMAQGMEPAAGSADNRRPDGTYVLKTDDLRSIQSYYRHVGAGRLILADEAERADMRETCLALGEHWRPLGHVKLPDHAGREAYPLYLCYYVAANPEDVARAKCANLGLVLLENRTRSREIVCGRPDAGHVARIES